ncbi:hypothetical protein BCV70DRAFT_197349 [Testicularia cyperi]|uniref:BTB domain-containing protein n=1 Tax=Testicularia cyperi TaxID=1882483 RepID=A0A317XXS7_9BASI|nr:hypothetical protein BCV70DRAFT_197349 [Testicularia cyperi]
MQNHVYDLGLLRGRCSDVRVRAFGRIYHLHRLFLIQSGFFRAMLCGGYAEDLAVSSAAAALSKKNSSASSASKSASIAGGSGGSRDVGADIIDLHFDDPNISRAAFEYCMARLYGDGPKLVLPFWSAPSSSHPFSPALSMRFDTAGTDHDFGNLLIEPGSHPATPRFLLSLLATSIYLNIPSITSQALTLVLCSVTPYTVSHYLRFAIGLGIEGTELYRPASEDMAHDLDEWDWELEGPARTLEKLARPDPHRSPSSSESCLRSPSATVTSNYASLAGSSADGTGYPNFFTSAPSLAEDDGHNHSGFSAKVSASPSRSHIKPAPDHGTLERSERETPTFDLSYGREVPSAGFAGVSFAQSSLQSGTDTAKVFGSTPTKSAFRSTTAKSAGLSHSAPFREDALQEVSARMPEYDYGTTADKIGEACVCWYARWGYDIFVMEQALESERVNEVETWIRLCREERDLARLSLLRDRLHTGDVDLLHTSMLPRGKMPEADERMPCPRLRVWSYPSMPSSWVRAIISSDSFFVHSEWKRYEFAKRIVEFRRKQKALIQVLDRLIDQWMQEDAQNEAEHTGKARGDRLRSPSSSHTHTQQKRDADGDGFGFKAFRRASTISMDSSSATSAIQDVWNDDAASSDAFNEPYDEDEAEYNELFSTGIYYSHMPFQELNRISCDVSPSTGRPYAPLSVLQAALWVSNELRNHILSSTQVGRSPSAFTWDNEVDDFTDSPAAAQDSNFSGQDAEGYGELGVSSGLSEFRQAFEASLAISAGSHRSGSRSRQGTPMSAMGNLPDLGFERPTNLGGISDSPLSFGSAGGKAGLLSKRYYLVPSDDTVRFGDGLMSVIGASSSVSSSNGGSSSAAARSTHENIGSDQGRRNDSGGRGYDGEDDEDDMGPTGHAATQIPHTVPIASILGSDLGTSSSNPRKDREHYYGVINDVATGRELGEGASRGAPLGLHGSTNATNRLYRSNQDRGSATPTGELRDKQDDAESGDAASTSSQSMPAERWSAYEPMRVGVEFFGIEKLQEKQRLYSPTFFYAGSIWNLYIQVVKKAKGIQLGVYLHRQSPFESLPPPSAPSAMENGEATTPSLSSSASPMPAVSQSQRRPSQRPATGTGGTGTPRLRTDFTGAGLGGSATGEGRGAVHPTRPSTLPLGTAGEPAAGASTNPQTSAAATAATATTAAAFGSDDNSSFFDTSIMSSPLRSSGGIPGSSTSSLGIGSSINLPSGQTITQMMGQAGSSLFGNVGSGGSSSDLLGSAANPPASTDETAAAPEGRGVPASSSLPGLSPSSLLLGDSPLAGASLHNSSRSSEMENANLPPIVPLFPNGPSVYQSCLKPPIPYRDPRKELRAYFSIHCPSPLGNALTRFSSGPDKFAISQSWGWKSSSLLGAVYLDNGDLESGRSGFWPRFRCVCTIGLV